MGKSGLGISDILDKLKNEFKAIEKASENMKGGYAFDVKDIELELQFAVKKTGKSGVSIIVVEAGGEYNKEEIQTIRIQLYPYKTNDDFNTNSQSTSYEDWKIRGGYNIAPRRGITLKRKASAKRSSKAK